MERKLEGIYNLLRILSKTVNQTVIIVTEMSIFKEQKNHDKTSSINKESWSISGL
jgi:hypothetical protein